MRRPRARFVSARLLLSASAIACALAAPANSGVNRWTENGPAPVCGIAVDPFYGSCSNTVGIALDPFDESIVYAITNEETRDSGGAFVGTASYLWRSADAGVTWTQMGLRIGSDSIDRLNAVRVSSSDPRTLYVLSAYALYRSTDGGNSWARTELPNNYDQNVDIVLIKNTNTLFVAQEGSCFILACGGGGVFRSDDGGKRWRAAGLNKSISGLAASPADPSTLYAYTGSVNERVEYFPRQLFQTTNSGQSWREVTPLSPAGVGAFVIMVVVDPLLPATIYAATINSSYTAAVLRSIDGARTWRSFPQDNAPFYGPPMAIDPLHPLHLLIATVDGGVARSTDGGESWTGINEGLTSGGPSQLIIAPSGTRYYGVIGRKIFQYTFVSPRRRAVRR